MESAESQRAVAHAEWLRDSTLQALSATPESMPRRAAELPGLFERPLRRSAALCTDPVSGCPSALQKSEIDNSWILSSGLTYDSECSVVFLAAEYECPETGCGRGQRAITSWLAVARRFGVGGSW